jgi:hypothetical protein
MKTLTSLLGAAALVGVALLVLTFVGMKTTLTCSRARGACAHVQASLLRSTEETFPVATLRGAAVRKYGRSSTHMVLLTTTGDRSFTGYGTGFGIGTMKENADTITSWVRGRAESVEVSQDDRYLSVLVALFPLGGALAVLRGAFRRLFHD